jgi:hypothetical protein
VFGSASLLFIFLNVQPKVQAQGPVKFSQQTIVFSFTLPTAYTPATFPVNNIGQAAHTISFTSTAPVPAYCPVFLEGSADNLIWAKMATVNSYYSIASANGQFQFFRISFNEVNDGRCVGGGTINYVGYQTPLPYPPNTINFYVTSVGDPVEVGQFDTQPMAIAGIQCYNPNASAAYLEIFDAFGYEVSPPALTAPFAAFLEIPATSSGVLQGNNLRILKGAYLGAATSLGGTVVSSTLSCNVQMNINGPFF